ncbi:hypothetical protein N7520_005217 [Penicillium odoratum]|uniref:uncharacterized protein n=1 Tax=Penicillium odoratum TaxID=1167516 RepID=UPI002547F92C|nr:uncharacterized protein N7520_005217 [Penicillium odoratum]KAJ5765658.1 hypothetical protein N7520_005217 [Penicillium odoratum]
MRQQTLTHEPAYSLMLSSVHSGPLSWIVSPINKTAAEPRLYRRSDTTSIELFFDLFFVANLSTFTATHEINNLNALGSYVGFLGVIWFTWLQVTLFDIRFAQDSVFERTCKALQLAVMIGFASAGTRFTTRVGNENLWAFQSLSLMLAGSRLLLAIQYTITLAFMYRPMKATSKGVAYTAMMFWGAAILYLAMFFAFSRGHQVPPRIWTVWFVLFGVEMWTVMGVSCGFPEIGFQETYLNIRMGLLTLIIIGEGVIAVTRIVNKTVRPGGWTKWSFVHILGVTTNVYLLWQVYFDLSPGRRLGKITQHIWAQLHFPFHVALILLLEGSQILALTLDVTLKLKYLAQTFSFVCEENRPSQTAAIALIRSTITDMEIPFSRGATQEWAAISSLLDDLSNQPLCSDPGTFNSIHRQDIFSDLMGNVTAALFSSMDITPPVKVDIGLLDSHQLLRMYMKLLAFVYIYFFAGASLSMGLFSAFTILARRHERRLHLGLSMAVRALLAISLASLVSFASHFQLAYSFMTSPIILYAFTLPLLTGQFFSYRSMRILIGNSSFG